jgi:hypothetical protein
MLRLPQIENSVLRAQSLRTKNRKRIDPAEMGRNGLRPYTSSAKCSTSVKRNSRHNWRDAPMD